MRLFVAVNLPPEIRDRLAGVQARLRATQADVSWVRPANIHITLKFLGETDKKRLERIRPALGEAVAGIAPFRVGVTGVGTFGGPTPRVVWAGVAEGVEPLAELARRVETAMARVGFPKERRGFTGHLTLGRVRSSRNAEALLGALRQEPGDPFGSAPVSEVVLMQSQLTPGGSIYTALDRFALGSQAPGEGGPGGQDGT